MPTFIRTVLAAVLAVLLVAPVARAGVAPQPPFDRDAMKETYKPIGFFKPGDPIPSPLTPPAPDGDGLFNPSGHWSAFDTNVYESLNFPSRQADDQTSDDPPGTQDARHGFCAPPAPGSPFFPAFSTYGKCANHQLEWLDHYERTMKTVLKDFGVVVKRYKFDSPGSGTARPGNPGDTSTPGGDSYNISATIPGADNPEEQIIVSGHFDFTDSGPAAAWDSQEGHAEVIRMAKIMGDYWKRTGTRPSATVKFMPWDQEETGTVGSTVWVQDNIPPGDESKVRGYFNVDPCAGAYPAFYHGNPEQRIPMTLGLADPANATNGDRAARITAFNTRAVSIIDEFFADHDDTVEVVGGTEPLYTDDDRDQIVTAIGGLLLFSSDYRNFEAIGVPFMNLSPDMFGPKADPAANTPEQSNEGISILHTPNDNNQTLNRLTGPDQTGTTFSDGWMKGMELCAQLESRYMLQPEMGGAQIANLDPVAYFEALPNEAIAKQDVTFDATGSYQYDSILARSYAGGLSYEWDFGDGTTGTGKTVTHAYDLVDDYRATLTVRGADSKTDTMTLPIRVTGSNFAPPVLDKPAAEDEDGTFPLTYDYTGDREGLQSFLIEEAPDAATLLTDDATQPPDAAAGTDAAKPWRALPPDDARIQAWQASDSGEPKVRQMPGIHRSEPRSFYTGMAPGGDNVPLNGPQAGTSVMEMKEPLQLPKGDVQLSYFSDFANDANDAGRLEVAIDTGATGVPLDYQVIDSVGRDVGNTTCSQECPVARGPSFELRKVDLSSLAGRKVRLRFVYALGAQQFVNVVRAGWYVDDLTITTGTFTQIGETAAKTFTVPGRGAGTYAYRVRAKFADSVRTGASNVESVKVTKGAPGGGSPGGSDPSSGPGPGPGGGTPAGGGPGGGGDKPSACVSGRAFKSAAARPRGGGLRFEFTRDASAPVSVEVFQTSSGRLAISPRRVVRYTGKTSSFGWNGRAKGRAVPSGVYFVRYRSSFGGGFDVRRVVLRRTRGAFKVVKPFSERASCGLLRTWVLSSPTFGGRRKRALVASYRVGSDARVSVDVFRGLKSTRAVKRFKAVTRPAGKTFRVRLASRGARRGDYRVRITVVTPGGQKIVRTLYSRLL